VSGPLFSMVKKETPLKKKARVLTKKSLLSYVREIRKKNKSIVFTNGCFDILHSGHFFLLRRAASFGDILIVGINSDSSVKYIKGRSRPLNPLRARLEALRELKVVDAVIPFRERTPLNLIKKLRPNVHVKGGDYKKKDLPETTLVHSFGGKVCIIPFKKGYSTTSLLRKLRFPIVARRA